MTFFSSAQDTTGTGCELDASFTYSISGGTINFSNTSTGEPAFPFYDWTIDGLSSAMENPSFPTADFEASEEVCLTVFDSLEDCIDTYCTTIFFDDDDSTGTGDDSTGTGCALSAYFTYTITGGTLNLFNGSTGEPAFPFYDWTVDGMTSFLENPTFSTAGFEPTEVVCLTVYDSLEDCIDTYCTTIYFGADDTTGGDSTGCALAASFTYSVAGGTLSLTNTSTGEPPFPEYTWTVDGMTSYEENPTFSTTDFEESEEVCLSVFDSTEDCFDIYCMTIYFNDDSTGGTDSTASLTFDTKKPIDIYPNPAKEVLNIAFNGNDNIQYLAIYSITGEMILAKQITAATEQYSLDVNSLPRGVYVIQLTDPTNPEKGITKKFVKE